MGVTQLTYFKRVKKREQKSFEVRLSMTHEIYSVVSFEKVAPFTFLHNWPQAGPALKALAKRWASAKSGTARAAT